MKHLQRAAVIGVVLIGLALAWLAWSPRSTDRNVLPGYVEGDTLYLSSPAAGPVGQVYVRKGQRVAAGAPLFAMDPSTLSAQQGQASSRLEQTRAQIGAVEAQAQQARASVAAAAATEAAARRDFQRLAGLERTNPRAVAAQQVDQARAAAASAAAQLRAAQEAASAAGVQIAAARASAGQAEAGLMEAGVRLGQLDQRAPAAGRIEEVFYQRGEWAGPNQPILALLPDGQIKLRFYAPETQLKAYQVGRQVRFGCDGCGARRTARITYVSPQSEFTPPMIYSLKSRGKLVFLVEAEPEGPKDLAPGLPVDVEPLAGAPR